MELFVTKVDGEDFVYLLDGIREDYGVMGINRDKTLVALFKPVNRVQAVRLDGKVEPDELIGKFGLNNTEGKAFASILNHHIPDLKEEEDEH